MQLALQLFNVIIAFVFFYTGKVIVTALSAIATKGKTYDDVPTLADSVRDTMVEVYERTSAELGPTKLS